MASAGISLKSTQSADDEDTKKEKVESRKRNLFRWVGLREEERRKTQEEGKSSGGNAA